MRILMMIVAAIISMGAQTAQADDSITTQKAILAGGCFWCLESDFEKLDGIVNAVSGYSGGTIPNPTYHNYHDKISGLEPHVEVVEVTYDASKLSYDDILDYFFRHIDPTDNGGQFCDRGPSYRPVVYYQNGEEKKLAHRASKLAEQEIQKKVKVDILPATQFWPAEDYHQNYAKRNEIKYSYYRWRCGRDKRVEDIWGSKSE